VCIIVQKTHAMTLLAQSANAILDLALFSWVGRK